MEKNDCILCRVIEGKTWDSGLLLEKTENFSVFPGSGAFLEGYLILVPNVHINSIALMEKHVQEEFFSLVHKWEAKLSTQYRKNIVVVEAGTDRNSKGKHAHSVVHAHVHLFPVDMPAVDVFRKKGCFLREIKENNLKSFKGKAYFLVCEKGRVYINDNPESLQSLPSQFHRFVVAEHIGKEKFYDWREYPFKEEMQKTYEKLK